MTFVLLGNRLAGRTRGQAVTEFALIVPVLILLLVAIFDLGRAVYAYSTIADAARTGGRVAIVYQDPGTDCTVVRVTPKCAAANQAVALGIAADGMIDVAGVPTESVSMTFSSADELGSCNPVLRDCIAEVTVRYQFSAATPIIGNLIGPITMSSTTKLPVEAAFPKPTP